MNYPHFFDTIEPIRVFDELSLVLGAFEKGTYLFRYTDVVRAAGHSCPTIAGAFLMAREGLKVLYKKEIPKRGEIRVFFKEALEHETTGVVANVFSLITGATSDWGFKGLGGRFDRRGLMAFSVGIPLHVRMQRTDTQAYIDIAYNPSVVAMDASLQTLMPNILSNRATHEEQERFGILWQERVGKILENFDKVILLQ